MRNDKQPDLNRLVGTLNIDVAALDVLDRQCREMKALDYVGVYFNNIFFTVEPVDAVCDERDVLFREDACLIVRRPDADLLEVAKIVRGNGLDIPSSHFLNLLPEPGFPLEAIFETHEKILDMAALVGLKRVTTHVGGIAVPQAVHAKRRPTPAELLAAGTIPYAEYADRVRELYGRDRVLPDSIASYRHLCAEAAKRGIAVSVETACSELYDVNTRAESLIDLIRAVGAPNFGICIDSGHCHMNDLDVADMIRRCGPHFLETHFHDNFADRDRHNPVGIGTIDWLAAIRAMRDIGYAGEITFEQGDYATNARNWRLFLEQKG
ncbi:MAG: sugar phosphate isomerase/epimerase family protein [Kiritimatiellia bacterium]|jgi:sugar phosphate isomerase/epimerase